MLAKAMGDSTHSLAKFSANTSAFPASVNGTLIVDCMLFYIKYFISGATKYGKIAQQNPPD